MSINAMITDSIVKHGFCNIHIRNGVLMIQAHRMAGIPEPLMTYKWMGKVITEEKAKHLIRTRFVQLTMGQHL